VLHKLSCISRYSLCMEHEVRGSIAANMPPGPGYNRMKSTTMIVLTCTCGWEGSASNARNARRAAAKHTKESK
jgi:hypothetical protein